VCRCNNEYECKAAAAQRQHYNITTAATTTTSTVATKSSNDGVVGGWTCEEITFWTVIGTITK
jgi:hypothetical protein